MRFLSKYYILVFCLSGFVSLLAANPPKGFEKVDQEITISTLEAQMKYDVQSFSVKPNSKVKVILKILIRYLIILSFVLRERRRVVTRDRK